MMVLSALRPDASLIEFLETRARAAPVRRLAIQAIAALALVTVAFSTLPYARSVVGTLAGVFFCYSVWGLLDRARSRSAARGWKRTTRSLEILCGLFVGLGVLSGLGSILAIWFVALGSAWVL